MIDWAFSVDGRINDALSLTADLPCSDTFRFCASHDKLKKKLAQALTGMHRYRPQKLASILTFPVDMYKDGDQARIYIFLFPVPLITTDYIHSTMISTRLDSTKTFSPQSERPRFANKASIYNTLMAPSDPTPSPDYELDQPQVQLREQQQICDELRQSNMQLKMTSFEQFLRAPRYQKIAYKVQMDLDAAARKDLAVVFNILERYEKILDETDAVRGTICVSRMVDGRRVREFIHDIQHFKNDLERRRQKAEHIKALLDIRDLKRMDANVSQLQADVNYVMAGKHPVDRLKDLLDKARAYVTYGHGSTYCTKKASKLRRRKFMRVTRI